MGDKWTLLIIRDLAAGPRRFVGLQRVLPGISTEQLRSRLNRMVADGLLTRRRYREVPPRVDYELTERAKALMPVLGALARWGLDWSWGDPRPSEAIDIGAILRLAPGLMTPSHGAEGVVECVVVEEDGGETSYVVTLSGGLASIAETEVEDADATIHGDQAAWVAALGPGRAIDALTSSGASHLVDEVLGAYADLTARVAA